MVSVRIRFDDAGLKAGLRALGKDGRFAVALALTRTAKAAQAKVISTLGDHFTVRTGWVAKGIRIKPATKASLAAEVGSKDQFMQRQEEGGTKQARSGRDLAVPVLARKNKSSVTRPGNWPGAMLRKPKVFIATFKSGHRAVVRRKGKGRMPIEVFYHLTREVRVTPRFKLAATVEQFARAEFAREFDRALWQLLGQARTERAGFDKVVYRAARQQGAANLPLYRRP